MHPRSLPYNTIATKPDLLRANPLPCENLKDDFYVLCREPGATALGNRISARHLFVLGRPIALIREFCHDNPFILFLFGFRP
ncbi:MAG: hypothetical protein EON54_00450 [Alcaligenaceae bacterium]|nr:MAG: hypothetical protein EON54_00450 [Alcaligenaceae bacterium]